MEQIPFSEIRSHSASHEIPRFFMEYECSLSCPQKLAIEPYPELHKSNPRIHALFL